MRRCYGEHKAIVATGVTQALSDVRQLVPKFERVHANIGQWPTVATANAGYVSAANVTAAVLDAVDLCVPPDKRMHDRKAINSSTSKPAAGGETPAARGAIHSRSTAATVTRHAIHRARSGDRTDSSYRLRGAEQLLFMKTAPGGA